MRVPVQDLTLSFQIVPAYTYRVDGHRYLTKYAALRKLAVNAVILSFYPTGVCGCTNRATEYDEIQDETTCLYHGYDRRDLVEKEYKRLLGEYKS